MQYYQYVVSKKSDYVPTTFNIFLNRGFKLIAKQTYI